MLESLAKLLITKLWSQTLAFAVGFILAFKLVTWWTAADLAIERMRGERNTAIAVNDERYYCAENQKITEGVSDGLRKRVALANDRYADAVASLWDARHQNSPAANRTGLNNGTAAGGRLYYADPAGAMPALKRAHIASQQAEQLIACQAFIRKTWELHGK